MLIKIAVRNTFAVIKQTSLQFVDNSGVRFPTTIEMEINVERQSGRYLRKRRRMRSKEGKSEVLA